MKYNQDHQITRQLRGLRDNPNLRATRTFRRNPSNYGKNRLATLSFLGKMKPDFISISEWAILVGILRRSIEEGRHPQPWVKTEFSPEEKEGPFYAMDYLGYFRTKSFP